MSVGVSPGSLERIEVVKGPASSLYGGYAMGGVVNMITRMPEKQELTLTGGYGFALDSPKRHAKYQAGCRLLR